MITAVKIYQNVFKARLSFELFDWLLTEAMLDRQTSFEELKIEKRYKLQLAMNVFPRGSTILHLIAKKSSKED